MILLAGFCPHGCGQVLYVDDAQIDADGNKVVCMGENCPDPYAVHRILADAQTDLMAGRALVLDAARAYDRGEDRRLWPAAAKYFASEMACRVADIAVQVHGGSGYIRGVTAERLYRDARLFRIYEGTSQIQQVVIARRLLTGSSRRTS